MVGKTNEMQEIRSILEVQFQQIEKQLKEYDRNILKILKKLDSKNRYPEINQYSEDVEIKVRSYMDTDFKT